MHLALFSSQVSKLSSLSISDALLKWRVLTTSTPSSVVGSKIFVSNHITSEASFNDIAKRLKWLARWRGFACPSWKNLNLVFRQNHSQGTVFYRSLDRSFKGPKAYVTVTTSIAVLVLIDVLFVVDSDWRALWFIQLKSACCKWEKSFVGVAIPYLGNWAVVLLFKWNLLIFGNTILFVTILPV